MSDIDPLRTFTLSLWKQAMMYPPSLPRDVQERAFLASNGELGIATEDVATFLAACRTDGIGVLGWELWLADQRWDFGTNKPAPAPGSFSHGIPLLTQELPAVFGGDGDAETCQRQLAAVDFSEVRPACLPNLRVNFTLNC